MCVHVLCLADLLGIIIELHTVVRNNVGTGDGVEHLPSVHEAPSSVSSVSERREVIQRTAVHLTHFSQC